MRYKALPVSLRLRRSGMRRESTHRTPPVDAAPQLRDKIATALMLASLPISLFVVFSVLAAGPTLHVSGLAQPGLQLTVGGSAFPRNDRIQLTWDGSASGMPLIRSDRSGSFQTDVMVPATATVGDHLLAAASAKPGNGKSSKHGAPAVLASVMVHVTAATASPTPTASPTVRPTPTLTPRPTASPTPTPKPTSSPSATPGPTATPPTSGSPITHVVIVWLENHEYSAVTSSSMPYLTGLASTHGLASNFYAVSHPSLPNYLAIWSGSTQGVTDDATYNLAANNLSKQLSAAGLPWKAYQQNYPTTSGCHTGSTYSGGVDGWGVSGTYARKHNPPMSFTSVTGSSTECAHVQPLANFTNTAALSFVTPNLCNDAHDCSLTTADNFLKGFLPAVFGSSNYQNGSTLLIVSFDEGSTSTNGGGHIYTMVARAGMAHQVSSTFHNHYGVTRTIEGLFGLPCLANACNAAPLSEFLP